MHTTRFGFGFGILAVILAGCGGAAKGGSVPMSPEAAPPSAGYPGGAYGGESASMSAPAQPGYARADAPAPAAPPPPPPPSPASAPEAKAAASAPPAAPVAVAPRAPVAPRELPASHQLTAGVWDDNRNFDFFKPYAASFVQNHAGRDDFAMFSAQELTTSRDRANSEQRAHSALDIQLLLDTTGSMGDELAYLQGEFDAISSKIHARFPNITPRWSLVLYRDKGDEYVTRSFDFTTDAAKFRRDLGAQAASGGGDTPEAVVQGFSTAVGLGWRAQDQSVAKMTFWVADAPTHPGEGQQLGSLLRVAQQKGIHVYPIAASDTDESAEYQMRSAAQLTGGRYVFLTNDSGIGNNHAEPHIPCYNVTHLDSAIVRMVEVELTGRHVEPESNEVLRSVGRPDREGKCKLASGALVASY